MSATLVDLCLDAISYQGANFRNMSEFDLYQDIKNTKDTYCGALPIFGQTTPLKTNTIKPRTRRTEKIFGHGTDGFTFATFPSAEPHIKNTLTSLAKSRETFKEDGTFDDFTNHLKNCGLYNPS